MGTDYTQYSENTLLMALAKRDPKARAELIMRYGGIAKTLASRYNGKGPDQFEDLFQEAILGIIMAVDDWDPKGAARLSTYAWSRAEGRIRNFLKKERKHRYRETPFSEVCPQSRARQRGA